MKFTTSIFLLGIALAVPTAAGAQLTIKVTSASQLTDNNRVSADAKALIIPEGYTQSLHWDLPLDSVGKNGSLIAWKSGMPAT